MILFKKRKTVECEPKILFEIMQDDLKEGLCTFIDFKVNGEKHKLWSDGDNGETKSNVSFHLDKEEYDTFEELKALAVLNNKNFYKSNLLVTVTECNGCYVESTPRLAVLIKD